MTIYVDGSRPFLNAQLVQNLEREPDVYLGAIVRFKNGLVALAKADAYENSNVLGIVETITGPLCTVRTEGISAPLYIGLDEAAEYFLSDSVAGGITKTPPTQVGHVLYRIGSPVGTTRLFVEKTVRIVRS